MTDNNKLEKQNTAVKKPHERLRDGLTVRKADLETMLKPHGIDVDAFINRLMVCFAKNPELQKCSVQSVILSALDAASLGLDCSGGVKGHGYLVPFNGNAVFMPGYRGLIDLIHRNTGGYVEAHTVRAKDNFRWQEGDGASIEHSFDPFADRGEIIGFYALFRDNENFVRQRVVMGKSEVDSIRDRAKRRNPVWVSDYEQMGLKTVIRRLYKYIPGASDPLIDRAIEMSDADYDDATNKGDDAIGRPPVGRRKNVYAKAVDEAIEVEFETVTTEGDSEK